MAALGKTYEAGDVDTTQKDFSDLPAGTYKWEIEASEISETGPEGARTGNGLKYTASVIEPVELEKRKFFGFINLENKSSQAQEIGQREFACLRRACEVESVSDSEQLHFIPYTIELGLGKDSKVKNADGTPKYPARMEVKKYFFPDEGNIPVAAISEKQPVAAKAANDNRQQRTASNDNKAATVATAAAGGAKKRPWGAK